MGISMSDLMIRAHFTELKKELSSSLNKDQKKSKSEVEKVLKAVFNYFKVLSQQSKLDEEGQVLYQEIAKVLDGLKNKDLVIPEKLPMVKSKGNKATSPKQRKTGT